MMHAFLGIFAIIAGMGFTQTAEAACEGNYALNANQYEGLLRIDDVFGDGSFDGVIDIADEPTTRVSGTCELNRRNQGEITFRRYLSDGLVQRYTGTIFTGRRGIRSLRGSFRHRGNVYNWDAEPSGSVFRPRAACQGTFAISANGWHGVLRLRTSRDGYTTGTIGFGTDRQRIEGRCDVERGYGYLNFTRYLSSGGVQEYEGEIFFENDLGLKAVLEGTFSQGRRQYYWESY